MKASTTLSLLSGALSIALPARFLDPISARLPAKGSDLVGLSESALASLRIWDANTADYTSGTPSHYAVFGEAMQFDVKCSEALSLALIYFRQPDPLSGSNLTNFLTTRYPNILRAACCAIAADFMDDEAAHQRFAARMTSLVQAANVEADLVYRGANLTKG